MKRLLTIALIVASTTIATYAQKDAKVLTDLLNEFLAGAGRNDAAIHDKFWADDLIYTRSAGVRTNKVDLMKGVRSAPAAKPKDPKTTFTAEDILINQYDKFAVVAFRLVSTTRKPDGSVLNVGNNLNTGVFAKRRGRWQAIAWQSTIVPKPAEK